MSKYIGTPVVNVSVDTVDVTGDITTTDSTPEVTIVNNTHEDTDGGREGKVTFKGQQSGGEETTLAQIQASHDGTSDDEKGDLIFKTNDGSDGASPTEAARIDSGQNLLVGTTSTTVYTSGSGGDAGVNLLANGQISNSSNSASVFNRMASDGPINLFYKDGSEVGRIGVLSSRMFTGTGDTGLFFNDQADSIDPWNTSTNAARDGAIDLGDSSRRFKDLYLTGNIPIGGDKFLYSYAGGSFGQVRSGVYCDGTNNVLSFYSSQNERMRIASSGDVGIGETAPTAKLHITESNNLTENDPHVRIEGAGYSGFHWLDGTAYYIGQNSASRQVRIYSGAETAGVALVNGSTSWGTFSDERLKYDVENIENAVETLSGLRTVKYRLNNVDAPDAKKKLGVIAQDLEGVLDEVVDTTMLNDDDTEYMSVRYTELIPVLIKAIQELSSKNDALETQNTTQATQIADLITRVTALEGE